MVGKDEDHITKKVKQFDSRAKRLETQSKKRLVKGSDKGLKANRAR